MSLQLLPIFRKPKQVEKHFADKETCIDFITKLRWNNGINCPHCGNNESIGWLEKCQNYKCYAKGCHKRFTATTGTLFHSVAPNKLPSWFTLLAFFVREDFTSLTWAGQLDLTQPNAWIMTTKLKMALFHSVKHNKLQGVVQVDETYMGGDPQKNLRLSRRIQVFKRMQEEVFGKTAYMKRKEFGKQTRGRKKGSKNNPKGFIQKKMKRAPYGHRTVVLGMHEQDGRSVYIVLGVDKNALDKKEIYRLLQEHIDPTAIVMTDEAPHYKKLNEIFPNHQIIRHKRRKSKKEIEREKLELIEKKKQIGKLIAPDDLKVNDFKTEKLYSRKAYIDGKLTVITTNGIEARWKYIKISYNFRCSYTREHMPGYLAEAAWRRKKDYSPLSFHERFIELVTIALNFKITAEEIKQFRMVEYEFDDPENPGHSVVLRVRRKRNLASSDFFVIIVIKQILNNEELFMSRAA